MMKISKININLGTVAYRQTRFKLAGSFISFPELPALSEKQLSSLNEVRESHIKWATACGFIKTEEEKFKLKQLDFPSLCTSYLISYPNEIIKIIPDYLFMIGFVDDTGEKFIQKSNKTKEEALPIICSAFHDYDRCMRGLPQENQTDLERVYPYYSECCKAIHDIHKTLVMCRGEDTIGLNKFFDSWKEYLSAVVSESVLNLDMRPYTYECYTHLRDKSGGIHTLINLSALLCQCTEKKNFFWNVRRSMLTYLTSRLIGQFNDFISLCKEMQDDDFHPSSNEISVIANINKFKFSSSIDCKRDALQFGVNQLVYNYNMNMKTFLENYEMEIPHATKEDRVYYNILMQQIRSNIDWSVCSKRYIKYLPGIPQVKECTVDNKNIFPEVATYSERSFSRHQRLFLPRKLRNSRNSFRKSGSSFDRYNPLGHSIL